MRRPGLIVLATLALACSSTNAPPSSQLSCAGIADAESCERYIESYAQGGKVWVETGRLLHREKVVLRGVMLAHSFTLGAVAFPDEPVQVVGVWLRRPANAPTALKGCQSVSWWASDSLATTVDPIYSFDGRQEEMSFLVSADDLYSIYTAESSNIVACDTALAVTAAQHALLREVAAKAGWRH